MIPVGLRETTAGSGHALFLLHARVFDTQGSWFCTVLLYSKKIFQTIFLFFFFNKIFFFLKGFFVLFFVVVFSFLFCVFFFFLLFLNFSNQHVKVNGMSHVPLRVK